MLIASVAHPSLCRHSSALAIRWLKKNKKNKLALPQEVVLISYITRLKKCQWLTIDSLIRHEFGRILCGNLANRLEAVFFYNRHGPVSWTDITVRWRCEVDYFEKSPCLLSAPQMDEWNTSWIRKTFHLACQMNDGHAARKIYRADTGEVNSLINSVSGPARNTLTPSVEENIRVSGRSWPFYLLHIKWHHLLILSC